MNKKLSILAAALVCACLAPAALAAPGETLSDCIDLSPGHEATRSGSQYLIVRSDDAHYRIGFGGGSCGAIALSSSVVISTDGARNRLCPAGTEVSSKREVCAVRSVEEIRADEFERYAKRARR